MAVPMLRTSERSAWRKCPQAWWWGYRMGLVPKGLPNFNFWFGIGWHEALAIHYGLGRRRNPVRARKALIRYFKTEYAMMRTVGDDGLVKFEEALDLALDMWDNYILTYGDDDRMDIIAVERSLVVPVYDYDGNHVVNYALTVDGAYRDRADHNKYKILEHKTASVIQTAHLSLDDQAGSYLTFMTELLRAEGLLKPKEKIQEITYNFARKEKTKHDDRPVNADGERLNKNGTVSANQKPQADIFRREDIPRSDESRRRVVDRVLIEVEQMNEMRADPSRVYKNPQGGPMGCTTCPFFDMCKLHEEGGDWEDLRDWKYNKLDPYADHRKAA